jgi:Cu+-exporting ATPase
MDQHTPQFAIDLSITGMSCASCVSRVEKSLMHVPGVTGVAVNLATEMAHVETASATAAALIAAVEDAGYGAALPVVRPPKHDSRRELLEICAGGVLSAPLLLGMFLPVPGWLALVLATPVQFWLGARFYRAGWNALRHGSGNMDLLVALGSSAAYFLSLADLLRGAGPLYFEAGAVVITLVRLGKFLEGTARRDAAGAINALAGLRPEAAHLVGKTVTDTPLAALRIGDVIELRPGERVPADGVILSGFGSLDEAHLTGESLAVARGPGGAVLAGALNLDAVLRVKITSAAGENFLDRMARLLGAAQASKPAVQRLADQVSAIFVPVVVVIALATFGVWLLLGASVAAAIINAVSVLVIACPCALGLATPAAILAGTGAAAKQGILIRDANALERAAQVDLILFDKTGTLTMGQPRLVETKTYSGTPEFAACTAAAIAAADTHPLSLALRQPGVAPAAAVRALPGRGVEGTVDGTRYILGSEKLLTEAGGAVPAGLAPAGASLSYLATAGGKLLARFAFADTARPDAAAAIARLRGMGCAVAMLSGDRKDAAEAIGRELGITDIIAEATPDRKLAVIQERRAAGARVAMVGDGVNDGAALAAADIGIAIGGGADVAIEAADISLLRPELMLVGDALALSRRTRNVLYQGLFWAGIYNLAGIPLAAAGVLSPMIAGAAMAASSVSVLAKALRLRRPA